jgi:hypothetical protein
MRDAAIQVVEAELNKVRRVVSRFYISHESN